MVSTLSSRLLNPYFDTVTSNGSILVTDETGLSELSPTEFGMRSSVTVLVGDNMASGVVGVASNNADTVFFTDVSHNIWTLSSSLKLFAGSSAPGYVDSANPFTAMFNSPGALLIWGQFLMVADVGNNCIRKVDVLSGAVSTLAGTGAPGYVNGGAAVASFNIIGQMACDKAGNLFVADVGNNAIRRVSPSGLVSVVAGSTSSGFFDGPSSGATFDGPQGIALSDDGTIYVSDSGNNAIRRITCSSGYAQLNTPGQGLLCIPCSLGYFAHAGDTNCTEIPPGYYAGTGDEGKTPCPRGTYSSAPRSLTCTTAKLGYYADAILAATKMIPCPSGHYSNITGAVSCVAAVAGYYANARIAATEQIPCPFDFYSASSAVTVCSRCAIGTTSGPASTSCTYAPVMASSTFFNVMYDTDTESQLSSYAGIASDNNGSLVVADLGSRQIRKISSQGKH
jgi:NHL repeat